MSVDIANAITELRERIKEHEQDETIRALDRLFGMQAADRDAITLLAAIDHVIDVLREAQANNGGYGFVRGLLEYLGAEGVS